MLLRDTIRTLPSGDPVPAGTEVRIYLESTGALLATVTTDANGMFEYQTQGNPGILRYEANVGTTTKQHSTRGIMPVAGFDLSGLPAFVSTYLEGVVVNYLGDLAVSANGSNMTITVAPGAALAKGTIYTQTTPWTVTLAPAAANPRLDTIAIAFFRDTSGDNVGRCVISHRMGNESPTPVAPPLTRDATRWDVPLATIRVEPGVLGIATNKVTDTRLVAIPFIPNQSLDWKTLNTATVPKHVSSQKPIAAATLGSASSGRDLTTLTLPAVPCLVKARAHVSHNGVDGDVLGRINVNAGDVGPTVGILSESGRKMDTAVHTFQTSGQTSLSVSWSYERLDASGAVAIRGGFLEWDVYPLA